MRPHALKLHLARSDDTFCHNDTDEAAPDVLDNIPDNYESTDSELEDTIDENQIKFYKNEEEKSYSLGNHKK